MKEHKRVICRVRGERGDYSCAGPSLLHGDRVNCRVSGTLNGVMIVEQDLHCYIVTADGRTYTAISRISPDIGWDIQVKTKNPFSSLSEAQFIQKRCVVSI